MTETAGATAPGSGAVALRAITRRRVVAIALPIVLSNALQPLQGAIDTAIVGHLGSALPLAAVALGAGVMTMLVGVFNFLQTGSSGLTAQALGAGAGVRVAETLLRALAVAGAIALAIIVLQGPITSGFLVFFEGSAEAEALAARYVAIRIWGVPAELALYAFLGWFAGQELTGRLFETQCVLSVSNIALNLGLVYGVGMGVEGVALGTALAMWIAVGFAAWRARARLATLVGRNWRPARARILARNELVPLMALNRDIFVRTILLMISFAWITRLGSLQSDAVLAANGVLLQFLFVTAAALDGFAIAAETLVGQAKGAASREGLRRAVRVSTEAAIFLAAIIAFGLTLAAGPLLALFTDVESVRAVAGEYVWWATLIPLVGVFAFQADGVFIGASEGRAMRNAMIVAAGLYLPLGWLLTEAFGNHGTWAAVWAFMALRAVTLAAAYPGLEARAIGRA